MKKLKYYSFIFLLGSVGGWFAELIWRSIYFNKLVNPGALLGPFCPIYGTAGVLLFLILKRKNNFFINFGIMTIVCTLIEYFTAVISEDIFHKSLWNYSKHPFNFQGRVCLDMTLVFVISGLIVFYFLKPKIDKFYENHLDLCKIFTIIFGIVFVLNVVVQFLMWVIR